MNVNVELNGKSCMTGCKIKDLSREQIEPIFIRLLNLSKEADFEILSFERSFDGQGENAEDTEERSTFYVEWRYLYSGDYEPEEPREARLVVWYLD